MCPANNQNKQGKYLFWNKKKCVKTFLYVPTNVSKLKVFKYRQP